MRLLLYHRKRDSCLNPCGQVVAVDYSHCLCLSTEDIDIVETCFFFAKWIPPTGQSVLEKTLSPISVMDLFLLTNAAI